jgi:hypothetical protein
MRLEFSCNRLDGRHGHWLRKIRRAPEKRSVGSVVECTRR